MNFFTSDWHLGHKNIIRFCQRPFDDVDHMNWMLIKNTNKLCGPNDDLYFLGDACMGSIDFSLSLISSINCRVHLIPGNHDRVHSSYWRKIKNPSEKLEEWTLKYLEHFDSIQAAETMIDSRLLCHFPYEGDSQGEDRYIEYRPVDNGVPLLCGHVHETWKQQTSDKSTPMVNVGVDVWNFEPVSGAQISAILKATT